MIKIDHLFTGPLNVNTYIIHNTESLECIVIDPAAFSPVYDFITANNMVCTHILLTHGHFDHIMGVAQLKARLNPIVAIHKDDKNALESDKMNLAVFVGTSVDKCSADLLLSDGDIINAAGIEIRVLHTPGHSKGSVCYIIESERIIFSGDTLFRLSVGRTDLYGSDKLALAHSIIYKLYALHGDYMVLPGHEEATELEFERQNNPITTNMIYE